MCIDVYCTVKRAEPRVSPRMPAWFVHSRQLLASPLRQTSSACTPPASFVGPYRSARVWQPMQRVSPQVSPPTDGPTQLPATVTPACSEFRAPMGAAPSYSVSSPTQSPYTSFQELVPV